MPSLTDPFGKTGGVYSVIADPLYIRFGFDGPNNLTTLEAGRIYQFCIYLRHPTGYGTPSVDGGF